MRVVNINNNTFGIYQNKKITKIGDEKVVAVNGKYKGNNISVYTHYTNNKKFSKLIFITDKCLNFLRLKLFRFSDDGQKQVLSKQSRWI